MMTTTENENLRLIWSDKSKLVSRRATIISILESINEELRANGIEIQTDKNIDASFSLGIRNKDDHLSHRGIALAGELYSKFISRDKVHLQNKMSFQSFSLYLLAVQRPNELGSDGENYESWCMYFRKLNAIDKNGFIHKQGFIRYRNMIERRYPLEADLKKLGMHLLPSYLVSWEKMQNILESILQSQSALNNEDKYVDKPILREMVWEAGIINPECLQNILSNNGEIYNIEQLREMLHNQNLFQNTMNELRKTLNPKWKLENILDKRKCRSGISYFSMNIKAFVAWVMSGRDKPKIRMVEYIFISFKTSIIRWMEELINACQSLRMVIDNIISRNKMKEVSFSTISAKHFTYEAKVQVNEQLSKNATVNQYHSGSSLSIHFNNVTHSNQILRSIGMPRGAGMVLTIDFPFHNHTNKSERETIVKNLEILFKKNFNNVIQHIPYFQSWKVFEHSISSGIGEGSENVLRIGFSWNRPTVLDSIFRELNLDFTLNDLLSSLKVDLYCSPSIKEMFCDHHLCLENDFSFKGNLSISFARELILVLLSKIRDQIEHEITTEKVAREKKREHRRRQYERTRTSHPHNPYIADSILNEDEPVPRYRNILHWCYLKRRLCRITDLIERLNITREKYEYFEIKSSSISDLFETSFMENFFECKNFNGRDHFANPGSLAKYWKSIFDQMCEDLYAMMNISHKHEYNSKKNQMNEQERSSVQADLERQKYELAQKLKTQGIKVDEKVFQETRATAESTEFFFHQNRLQSLLTYGLLKKHIQGISSITLLNGKSLFKMEMKGIDLIDIFPDSNFKYGCLD